MPDVNLSKNIQDVLLPLNTTWDQNCYYNALCPSDNISTCLNGGTPNPCGHVYTGCPATAMAQIMKYWNYPPSVTDFYPLYQ